MKAELLSVDFTHEDCGPNEMVINFRTAKGGVIGGVWEVFCPAIQPNPWTERDMHLIAWRELREAFLHDPDHDNETINWALDIFDSIAPQEVEL